MSKKKVLLRGVFINRDTNGEGVLKVGTTLIRVSTVMGILYRYQNRYYGACKKLKTGETNTDNHGAMLEMSYVLISIFGLSPKEVDEVEKNGGFTNKDLKKIEEETEKYVKLYP